MNAKQSEHQESLCSFHPWMMLCSLFSFGVCIRSCTVRVDIDLCVRVIGDEIRVFPLNVATEFANFKDRVTLYYRDLPVLVSWLGRRIQDGDS